MRAAIMACAALSCSGAALSCSGAALSCSGAALSPPCAPHTQRCRENAVEVCSVGVWVADLDCAEHNARCSVEPGGDAVCVVGE